MARCPACNKKLRIWHIKAECPYCNANIPNHDWENRLEEDSLAREAAYFKLHTTLKKLKFSVVGSPLRIIRFIFSFLTVVGYIVPLACLKFQSGSVNIDIGNISAITFFTDKSFKIADIFKLITADLSAESNKFALISLGLFVLSLLFTVLAFAFIPILCKKIKQSVTATFHAISLILYSLIPFFFSKFAISAGAQGGCLWGVYLGAALYIAAFAFDLLTLSINVDERAYKYVPVDDVLQREYAISINAIEKDEMPYSRKNKKEGDE